jgi:hypothetical protein
VGRAAAMSGSRSRTAPAKRNTPLARGVSSGGAAGRAYSQNFVTGTGSDAPLPSQNISFESTPWLTR